MGPTRLAVNDAIIASANLQVITSNSLGGLRAGDIVFMACRHTNGLDTITPSSSTVDGETISWTRVATCTTGDAHDAFVGVVPTAGNWTVTCTNSAASGRMGLFVRVARPGWTPVVVDVLDVNLWDAASPFDSNNVTPTIDDDFLIGFISFVNAPSAFTAGNSFVNGDYNATGRIAGANRALTGGSGTPVNFQSTATVSNGGYVTIVALRAQPPKPAQYSAHQAVTWNSTNRQTLAVNIPAGTNQVMLIMAWGRNSSALQFNAGSADIDGSGTGISDKGGTNDTSTQIHMRVWRVTAPASGAHTIGITPSQQAGTGEQGGIVCLVYEDIDQTTPEQDVAAESVNTGNSKLNLTTFSSDPTYIPVIFAGQRGNTYVYSVMGPLIEEINALTGTGGSTGVWSGVGAASITASIAVNVSDAQGFGITTMRLNLRPHVGGGGVTMVIQDASHGLSTDSPDLTQANTLAVLEALHAHLADAPSFTQANTLATQDSLHSHLADSPSFTQANVLGAIDSIHSQVVDNIVLEQGTILAVADGLHGHSSETPSLVQANVLGVLDAIHALTSESPSFLQQNVLAIFDAIHAHSAEQPTLIFVNILSVQDSQHNLPTDNVVLLVGNTIPVNDSFHAHSADSPALVQANILAVQEALHGHAAENLVITPAYVLVVADAHHTLASDAPTLAYQALLQVQDALHAHFAEQPSLSSVVALNVHDAWHLHYSGSVLFGWVPIEIVTLHLGITKEVARILGVQKEVRRSVLVNKELSRDIRF